MAPIFGLGDDLIEQICILLAPVDFLSFVQTCRYLYAFSFSDYIWHQIARDLILDVDTSQNWKTLPGTTVKALAIKAMRLDSSWRTVPSHIKRITAVQTNGGPFNKMLAMIPLGGEWLVTWDAIRTAQVSLWRLPGIADVPSKDDDLLASVTPVQVLNLNPEPGNTFRVEAVRQEGADDIVLVAIMGVGVHPWDKKFNDVQIHKVDLKGRKDGLSAPLNPYIVKTWSIIRQRLETAFYYMQIFCNLVVVACEGDGPNRHLIIFNTATETTYIIKSPALSTMFEPTKMQFKLYSDGTSTYMILAGPYRKKINVLVRLMPPEIGSRAPSPVPSSPQGEDKEDIVFEDFAASIVDYSLSFSTAMEFYISPEPPTSTTPIETFTLLANTRAFMESPAQESTSVYRFPINVRDRDKFVDTLEPILRIQTPVDVTLETLCLGKTGARAVWSTRDWNLHEHVLIRAQLPSLRQGTAANASGRDAAKEIVTPLQSPSIPLPFQQEDCRSLSFDEASGRVFAGTIRGDIYIIHF